jgi:hypothetical protein
MLAPRIASADERLKNIPASPIQQRGPDAPGHRNPLHKNGQNNRRRGKAAARSGTNNVMHWILSIAVIFRIRFLTAPHEMTITP